MSVLDQVPRELALDPSEVEQMAAVSTAVKRRRAGKEMEHRHRAQSIIQQKALDELETEVFQTGLYENIDIHRGSCYSVLAADIAFSECLTECHALWGRV